MPTVGHKRDAIVETDRSIEFNLIKCEVMYYHQKEEPVAYKSTYSIHGHKLVTANTRTNLDVPFASDLSGKAQVDARTKSANSALAFLRKHLSRCQKNINLQCNNSLFRPVLD